MSASLSYYNDLWLIGAADERRRAESWLNASGALDGHSMAWAMGAFHPDLGHEVASVLMFTSRRASFHADAPSLARRFPTLRLAVVACDEDGDSARWDLYHGDQPAPGSERPYLHHASNDPEEVVHDLRREVQPAIAGWLRAVPLPPGTPLEQATRRDDGDTVARLLADPSTRPDHPELWWDGLHAALRRQAIWVDLDRHRGHHLHGRSPGWTRSAVDAWARAFPPDLRDVSRLTAQWGTVDVCAHAALAHWVGAIRVYNHIPMAHPTDLRNPNRQASGGANDVGSLTLPVDLAGLPPADRQAHDALLASMRPRDRDRLLNHWLSQIVHDQVADPAYETQAVHTLTVWHDRGWLPACWTDGTTLAWLGENGQSQIRSRLEAWALSTTLAPLPSTVASMPRSRPRL